MGDIFLLSCILLLAVDLSAGHRDGTIRLVGGEVSTEGRVEIYHSGVWGTVCDDNWDLEEAKVVCRQLGFSGALESVGSATFGQGSGKIWMDDLRCDGSESKLSDCNFNGWGDNNCSPSEDAGVRCEAGHRENDIRLVDGELSSEGRVEIYHDGVWGTVCDDEWDMDEARVVCRQLGFSGAIEAVDGGAFGQGSGKIWMDDVECDGTEARLSECSFNAWGDSNCSPSEDAGVRCVNDQTETRSRQNRTNVSRNVSQDVCQGVSHKYSLDYNSSLSFQLGELFNSRRDCDFDIAVVVDGKTLDRICAHRLILSMNSFFNTSKINFSELSINVTANCSRHVTSFVRYLYTRQIELTPSSAQCIHKMASDWDVEALQSEAANYFAWFLPEDPTFLTPNSFYEYAVLTSDKGLQETCLRYLAWNCEALIQSTAWTSASPDLVKALLSRSDLVVPSETYVLKGLESWMAAQQNKSISETLLELIRFPMIPAEDLYRLNDSQYQAKKLQGFQYNALPFGMLFDGLAGKAYTSRIYTGRPWSFSFSAQDISDYKDSGFYTLGGQRHDSLKSSFHTPLHDGAYFVFHSILWNAKVYISDEECSNGGVTCTSLPAVSLKLKEKKRGLPRHLQKRISYNNRLVVMCEDRHVFHVEEFKGIDGESLAFVPINSSAGQVYPCHSKQFSYHVVVRPQYTAG